MTAQGGASVHLPLLWSPLLHPGPHASRWLGISGRGWTGVTGDSDSGENAPTSAALGFSTADSDQQSWWGRQAWRLWDGIPQAGQGGGHRRTAPRPSGLLSLSLMRAGGQPVASAGPCPFLPRPRPLTRKTFPRGGQSHRGQSERELGGTEAPGDTSCLLLVVLQRWPPPGCWETLTRIRETASPPCPPRPPVPGEVSSRRGGWGASP